MTDKRLVENERFFSTLLGLPIGEYSHSHEELHELFLMSKKILSSERSLENGVDRRNFYSRWKKMVGRDADVLEKAVFLRAFLVEKMEWTEIAILAQCSVSRVRSMARSFLFELIESGHDESLASVERGCAMLDIHLLEYLRGDGWNDPLSLYGKSDLLKHSQSCARCRAVVEGAQSTFSELQEESASFRQKIVATDFSPAASVARQKDSFKEEPQSESELSTPWSWAQVSAQGVVFAVLVGAVLLIAPKHEELKRGILQLSQSPLSLLPQKPELGTENVTGNSAEDLAKIESQAAAKETENLEEGEAESAQVEALEVDQGEQELAISAEEPEFVPPMEALVLLSSADPLAENSSETVDSELEANEAVSDLASAVTQKSASSQKQTEQLETTKVFFRWGARAEDPDRVALKVLEMMNEISVTNVSEFSLGADYKGGKYFHFTVTTDDYKGLLSKIRSLPLTDFTYSQSKGSRDVPIDRSRVVLWIGPSR